MSLDKRPDYIPDPNLPEDPEKMKRIDEAIRRTKDEFVAEQLNLAADWALSEEARAAAMDEMQEALKQDIDFYLNKATAKP